MIPHYGLTDAEAYEIDQWSAALARVDHGDAADPSTEPRACPEGWVLHRRQVADCDLCCEPMGPHSGYYQPTQHIGRHIRCPGGST